MAIELEAQVHSAAHRTPLPEVARALQELFGQRLTAVIAGVSDVRAIGRWARSEREPQPEHERHLRDAYQIAQLLLSVESPSTVRLWFTGMNPLLDDRSPALVVGEDPVQTLRAARAFLANG
jgi:hypothetical protein